jgi:hypothetical protein
MIVMYVPREGGRNWNKTSTDGNIDTASKMPMIVMCPGRKGGTGTRQAQ